MGCCSFNDEPVKENISLSRDEQIELLAKEAGVKPRPSEVKDEIDERGAFIRQPNAFTTPFGDKEDQLKADANRFGIFWMHGCHWSNRPVIARDILGLEDVIGEVHTTSGGKYGHSFPDYEGQKDPLGGAYFLSQYYFNADPDFKGRATTPTLVDYKEKKAVNNDYHRLSNYIEVQFRKYQPVDAPDLYPVKYRKEIDEFNDWLFPHINNSHYRMAFCQSWEAYNEAYEDFFDSLEKLDKRLAENRFLFGDFITDADIRLYVTLVRWETWYYKNVGPMKKRVTEYENVWGYVKDLFSLPVFKKYTFFEFPEKTGEGIFETYDKRIASQVPYEQLWESDGSRKKLSNTPDEVFKKHPDGETVEDYQTEISQSKWNSPKWEDRNPANGVLSVDASINPIESKLRD